MRVHPSLKLGLFWGLLLILLGLLGPRGRGAGVFLFLVAIYLVWNVGVALVKKWQAGKVMAVAGLLMVGALVSLGSVLIQGREPEVLTYALFFGAMGVAGGLLLLHARLCPDPWRELGRRVERATLLGLLVGSQIPRS